MLEGIRESGRIFFTTKDLKYLERGGRIGKAACVVGSMLEIKPLLQFYDGELGATELCRGRKRSLQKVAQRPAYHKKGRTLKKRARPFLRREAVEKDSQRCAPTTSSKILMMVEMALVCWLFVMAAI